MSLSEKSEEELSSLLTEYGIKHGPIVDSTRRLYERKLEKAMEEDAAKPSSDKTYYREEEDEVTYITYHSSTSCREKPQGSQSQGSPAHCPHCTCTKEVRERSVVHH
ncbi:emerin (Emery-Dreifuss muscular dystrophy) isoform X2 [Gouania willdenowi]|uniref:emerin (Emery-Dreifuss muscular dystrophy) isoform X2 n=1 Tax=Gouania willdenowi TaxID=441366 RepID=UPI001056AE9A|nr:uncharacterized protein LOC114467625 isoform X2 [Gouania willdenowi]